MKFILLSSFLVGCGNPSFYLDRELKKYKYIPYNTPLEVSGTGTLVAGSPDEMYLIADPETCFPQDIVEELNMRKIDRTTLPSYSQKYEVSGDAILDLLKIMSKGNPTLKAGVRWKHIQSIELEMKGAHIEYFDSIALTHFYNKYMSIDCMKYLNYAGFIIQALKVEELIFKFYKTDGQQLFIDVNNIEEFVDIGVDIKWKIDKNISLIIETPKYIGYRLGRLKIEDHGMALYRASEVTMNKYRFKNISIFKNPSLKLFDDEIEIPFDDQLDNHSHFIR
ncbi:hypothetical protein OAB57_03095 [Bacteriovoracaceae bacterium]|nr:hypothetical protein [Bacteriovoracaceae bacterium]